MTFSRLGIPENADSSISSTAGGSSISTNPAPVKAYFPIFFILESWCNLICLKERHPEKEASSIISTFPGILM